MYSNIFDEAISRVRNICLRTSSFLIVLKKLSATALS